MEVILASLLACLDSYFKRSFRFLHVSILACFSLQVFSGGIQSMEIDFVGSSPRIVGAENKVCGFLVVRFTLSVM